MVRKQLLSKYITLENVIGVLLAILIIFDLKIEESICKVLNTPMGMVSSGILLIILFVMLHPVIGILFLIYLYQCMQTNRLYNEESKTKILKQLNPVYEQQVEEQVILEKAPIKNQNRNNNVEFSPYSVNVGSTIL
jgi:predicted membrane protein